MKNTIKKVRAGSQVLRAINETTHEVSINKVSKDNYIANGDNSCKEAVNAFLKTLLKLTNGINLSYPIQMKFTLHDGKIKEIKIKC